MRPDKVDIWSKGEVIQYLFSLVEKGQIKDCEHLQVQKRYADAYYPECIQDWASRESAHNVTTNVTGYGAPSSYYWPVCPSGCPVYSKSDNFLQSLNVNQVPQVADRKKQEVIDTLANRFHLVARDLRKRHSGRTTIEVEDEYDVQDLFRALLTLYFDDIRPEEWTPSYAGT